MDVVYVETDDIGTIKSIIEILNGTVPEANADFIKDARAFNANLDKNKGSSDNTGDDDSSSSSGRNHAKGTKNVVAKAKPVGKKIQKDDVDDDEEIDEPVVKGKGRVPVTKNVRNTKKKQDDDDDSGSVVKGGKANIQKNTRVTKKKQDDEEDNLSQTKVKAKGKQSRVVKKKQESDDEEEDEEVNRGQIKILTADQNQVMIIYILLNGSAFKKFVVHPDKYSVGINLDELSKYIKNVDKEGTMSIRINSEDTQHIVFDVKGDNSATSESICELRVVNLPSRPDRKICVNVMMAVRINCHAFHKACKDLMQFSKYVEITCDPSQLAITCKGDMSNHKRIFKADGTQNGVMIRTVKKDDEEEDNVPDIIRLVFDLNYINSMYKCSNLCDDMEIYLNSDSIMFLKYGIKLMGEMLVGISPSRKKKENAENYDEKNDAFYDDGDEVQLI